MEQRACKSCGAAIIWASIEPSGKSHPVDAEPSEAGNIALSTRAGRVVARVLKKGEEYGHPRRTSHFATCPNAAQHRGG